MSGLAAQSTTLGMALVNAVLSVLPLSRHATSIAKRNDERAGSDLRSMRTDRGQHGLLVLGSLTAFHIRGP